MTLITWSSGVDTLLHCLAKYFCGWLRHHDLHHTHIGFVVETLRLPWLIDLFKQRFQICNRSRFVERKSLLSLLLVSLASMPLIFKHVHILRIFD